MSLELLPPDENYPTDCYHVRPNYCKCHPETCCCSDWAVHAPDGSKLTTFFYKENALDHADWCNRDAAEGN